MAEDTNKQKHEHLIHYEVDDEPQSTTEKELTPKQIMASAGIDAQTNYLEEIAPKHESYKGKPEEKIDMKDGMRFITKPIGPMPVS
jgi:hypothetical protein